MLNLLGKHPPEQIVPQPAQRIMRKTALNLQGNLSLWHAPESVPPRGPLRISLEKYGGDP